VDLPRRKAELEPRLAAADEDCEWLYLRYQGWLDDALAAGRDLIFFYS
jgi:hypothetical protein